MSLKEHSLVRGFWKMRDCLGSRLSTLRLFHSVDSQLLPGNLRSEPWSKLFQTGGLYRDYIRTLLLNGWYTPSSICKQATAPTTPSGCFCKLGVLFAGVLVIRALLSRVCIRHVYTYTFIYTYKCAYMCMCVHIYMGIYIYIYVDR